QLTSDRTEDAGATGVRLLALENHRSVLVELDVRTVLTTGLLDGADDDRLDDIALLDVAAGDGVLHRGDDDVTNAGVATMRSAEHTDAQQLLGTRVVGDAQSRLLLNHFFSPVVWFSRRSSTSLVERTITW